MNTRTYVVAGLSVLAVVLFAVAWWLLGTPEPRVVEGPRRGVGRVAKRVQIPNQPSPRPRSAAAEAVELPDEEIDGVKVTKTCRYISEWKQNNVMDFVIVDNLEARGQRFTEDDLACLSAAGVGPGVMRYAEINSKTPSLDGGKIIVVE